jgi:phosphoglycerate dehydrogenase-like enzyme
LGAIKKGGILINAANGQVVDIEAPVATFESKIFSWRCHRCISTEPTSNLTRRIYLPLGGSF